MMPILWKRIGDRGKNWRHVHKGLMVFSCLIQSGNQNVIRQCKKNIMKFEELLSFEYSDHENNDQGLAIQAEAQALIQLLLDEEALSYAVTNYRTLIERCNASGSSEAASPILYKKTQRIHSVDELDDTKNQSDRNVDVFATTF